MDLPFELFVATRYLLARRRQAFISVISLISVIGVWFDPTENDAPHREWTEAAWQKLKSEKVGAYSNFLSDEGEDRIRDAYPDSTYNRLAELKRIYDPENFFQLNQNIRPR